MSAFDPWQSVESVEREMTKSLEAAKVGYLIVKNATGGGSKEKGDRKVTINKSV